MERTEGQWQLGTNDSGTMVFEPPPSVRGDISRSLFYFSVRYDQPIPDTEELTLRRWHNNDPVDQRELRRASIIEESQGNSNPFIIDRTTVDRIKNF